MTMFIQLLVAGLVIGSIYGLIALGYSLIYKASGLMNFAQGDMLTIGAFLGYTFFKILGIPFIPSLILIVVSMFILGIILQRGVIRVMVNRHAPLFFLLLATISVSIILKNGAQYIWGTLPMYFPPVIPSLPVIKVFGVQFQTESIICIGAAFVTMFLLHLFVTKSKIGTSMRAVAQDTMAAEACGINVSLSVGITWGLSAAIAGFAGMMLGPVYGVFTSLGAGFGRKGFASAVFGGYGNMYGAILGGLVIGVGESFITGYVSSTYKNLFTYGLLLIFLFVKPTGVFNERAIRE